MDAIATPTPWRTIWFSPRRTIRALVDAEVRPSWVPVIVLAALHQAIGNFINYSIGGRFSTSTALMPAIVGIAGLIFAVLVGPFLLAFVGGWLGGEADPEEIRLSVAWSYIPWAVAAFFWIPLLLAYPSLPSSDANSSLTQSNLMAGLLVLLIGGVYIVATLWALVLQIATLAEVQRFSISRAIASYLILAIPLLILAGLR